LAAHYTRNLTEGSGSACLRAAFKIRDRLAGKRVAIQMSGGNASAEELQNAMVQPCLRDGAC
jgi:threonine dehydratase